MAAVNRSAHRAIVDGKFFRVGDQNFHIKGLTYGPFAPNGQKEHFPSPEQAAQDFTQICDLGANLVRVYYVPPLWFLDLADRYGLKILVDAPWRPQVCFLDSEKTREEARAAVRQAAQSCARHPALFAISVVNEIPPDIVRWSGAKAVEEFIDELVAIAKGIDPDCLCTFGNYPPTEFLQPREIDFLCFNVYLHNQRPFGNYLARLQMIADAKPLLLGEFGIDSLREGEARQRDIVSWQIESAFRAGLAGAIVFSYTDDWYRGEHQVLDWQFGLTTRERQPKEAFAAVQKMFAAAPYFPLSRYPMVSVVVACYNGARTLKACLDSLQHLNYPQYEVILIDDGSTDQTPQIAAQYTKVRYIGLRENKGLSVARNTGIEASQGEVIAFTDADCRADKDWLYYLVGDLIKGRFAGIGGHNFLPPEDSWMAAAVLVSPGGPAHVMLTDRLAEHIPGCNMAFYKWALDEIGGFDPVFHKAGDDVDVCWRLQQRGLKIGFSPAGFVWHYRRSTVRDYLAQQAGYGEAEALLVRKHPEYFNALGGSLWSGRIYSTSRMGIVFRRPMIYHGAFASGFFQSVYTGPPAGMLAFFTSLEYYVLLTLPLLVLSAAFGIFTHLAITTLLFPVIVCVVAAAQAQLPKKKKRFWSRPLVALLFFLQPLIRGAARYQGRLMLRSAPVATSKRLEALNAKYEGRRFDQVDYWAEQWVNRIDFVTRALQRLDTQGWQNKTDSGWDSFDIEVAGNRWSRLQLTTVSETYHDGKQMFRCRLRTAWSLPAHIVFWSAFGGELLIVGALAGTLPWLWLLLLTLPAIAWVIRQQQRDLQRMMAFLLDEVAEQMGLKKVLLDSPAQPEQHHSALDRTSTL